jgi:hypothetical protein
MVSTGEHGALCFLDPRGYALERQAARPAGEAVVS